ncbi:hypothetical protein KUTeg_022060 [Tegillarca granosa]|uniref:Uncharacterized protein n=1 Tax=Tegillarca granosa TaxID=220873 RepID=A0ABQ9E814_TEGGR|nr:hypothetical protein KUTeg_022060 [Tegillarca granosa]
MASSSDSDFEKERGNFTLNYPWSLDLLFCSSEEELSNIDYLDAIASTMNPKINEFIREILQAPAFEGLPPPQQPVMPSPSPPPQPTTKSQVPPKNTAWGVKVFQEWHTQVYNYGERLNFSKGTPEELSEKLRKFHCEVRTKKREPLP